MHSIAITALTPMSHYPNFGEDQMNLFSKKKESSGQSRYKLNRNRDSPRKTVGFHPASALRTLSDFFYQFINNGHPQTMCPYFKPNSPIPHPPPPHPKSSPKLGTNPNQSEMSPVCFPRFFPFPLFSLLSSSLLLLPLSALKLVHP